MHSFDRSGVYTVQDEDGKTLIPSSKDIVEKWKENYPISIRQFGYNLANVSTLEDSYQLRI